MRRNILNSDHPDIADSALTLASWLTDEQQYDEAEMLLDEGIQIRRAALGNTHTRVASSLIVKANLYLAQERFQDALALAEGARETLLMSLQDDHWTVAAAESVAGAALTGLGSYADVDPLWLRSLEPLAQSPIPGLVEKNKGRLANLYLAWGKSDKSQQYTPIQ